jgi:acyl-CoA thioester hydrolase
MAKLRYTSFPQPETWWPHQVSYGETDSMGVVYYGNYLHWFEQARCHYLRELELSYKEIEKKGLYLMVREAFCHYLAPARFEEQISVRTGIGHWGRASLTFYYEIYNLTRDKTFMTSGYTLHACVRSNGSLGPVPSWLKNSLISSSPGQ